MNDEEKTQDTAAEVPLIERLPHQKAFDDEAIGQALAVHRQQLAVIKTRWHLARAGVKLEPPQHLNQIKADYEACQHAVETLEEIAIAGLTPPPSLDIASTLTLPAASGA